MLKTFWREDFTPALLWAKGIVGAAMVAAPAVISDPNVQAQLQGAPRWVGAVLVGLCVAGYLAKAHKGE